MKRNFDGKASTANYAEALGLTVPDDIAANNKRLVLKGKLDNLDEAKKKYEQAQQELEEFNNGIVKGEK